MIHIANGYPRGFSHEAADDAGANTGRPASYQCHFVLQSLSHVVSRMSVS